MKRRNVYLVSVAGVALVAGVIIATQLAKNNLYGYKTEGEYASIEAPSNYTESDGYQVSIDEDIASNPIISEYTLDTLTENHLAIFQVAITGYPERIKSGSITIEQGDAEQNEYISIMVMENELPENGESLFGEWKESTGYYAQFEGMKQPEVTEPAENKPAESNSNSSQQGGNSNQQSGGSQSNQSSQPSGGSGQTSKPSGGNSSKPQPSTEQQQQQQEQQQQQDSGGGDFKTTTEENNDMLKSSGSDGNGSGLDWSLWE